MLRPATLQALIEFAVNESGQVFALAGQFGLELRPVLMDDMVEQGGLGALAYVSRARCWTAREGETLEDPERVLSGHMVYTLFRRDGQHLSV